MKLLLSFFLCWNCQAWSIRRWASRTSRPLRTLFEVATIATAISIGPMNAAADNTASQQTSFFKDPFRTAQRNPEADAPSAAARSPSRTAVITGTGVVIAFSVRAKATSTDEMATKRRRRELSLYMKKKKKHLENGVHDSKRKRSRVKQSLNHRFNKAVPAVLSTDRNAFTKSASDESTPKQVLESRASSSIPKINIDKTKKTEIQAQDRVPVKPQLQHERDLSAKYAAIESLEERAFQILLDLGMIEQTSGPSTIP